MYRAKNNPKFFEPAGCSECGEMGIELMKHKYTDELLCVECVNKKLKELEDEESDNNSERSSIWGDRGFNSASEYSNFIKGA